MQMCEAGGTTKPSANFMTGKTSRSLKAAYRVVTEKLAPQAAHLDGGAYAWCASITTRHFIKLVPHTAYQHAACKHCGAQRLVSASALCHLCS